MHSASEATRAPRWVVRHHAPAAVHSVSFANGGMYLIAGDAKGRVSVTHTTDYRPRLFWDAHKEAILRADAWNGYMVTYVSQNSHRHGRDNCVRVWSMPDTVSAWGGQHEAPPLTLSVEVNALNYCAYAMALRSKESLDGWMAVPNTLESAWIDIYALPQRTRVREAVGRQAVLGHGAQRPPIVMTLQLALAEDVLRMVAGYEDGTSQAWSMRTHKDGSLGEPELLWSLRSHTESIMGMCLTPDHQAAVSVGADQHLVRAAFSDAVPTIASATRPGNASVAVRADARILAVGSWDGKVRIFSFKDTALLATLTYHKEGIQAVAYIRTNPVHTLALTNADESSDEEGHAAPPRPLLAAGSKDGRISLWDLPFSKEDIMPARPAQR